MDDSAPWMLAQLKPNAARIALRNLHRQGFTTFLPWLRTTAAVNGRVTERLRPLFPGYLFLACDPGQPLHLRAANATLGVARLVGSSTGPARVPAGLVEGLRARCDADQVLRPAPLAPGDEVLIAAGPLASLIATVERVDENHRVHLLLQLLNRETRLVATPDQVRRPG